MLSKHTNKCNQRNSLAGVHYFNKAICVDNGMEFINKRVKEYLREQGIELQTTVPYSPSQNGIAE